MFANLNLYLKFYIIDVPSYLVGRLEEMKGKNVANLEDAYEGLRLALRGRIGLRPEFIFFEDVGKTFERTDAVVEDMLLNSLNVLGDEIYKGIKNVYETEEFIKEINSLLSNGLHNLKERLSECPNLKKAVDWMKAVAPEKVNDETGSVSMEYRTAKVTTGGHTFWTDTRNGNADIYYDNVGAPGPILSIESISGGFGVKATVKNAGTADAENVEWSIVFDGPVFIGKEKSGTVTIPAGGEALPHHIALGIKVALIPFSPASNDN